MKRAIRWFAWALMCRNLGLHPDGMRDGARVRLYDYATGRWYL